MRFVLALICLCSLGSIVPVRAQQVPPASPDAEETPHLAPLFAVGSSEWMITAGPARAVEIFHSSSGHHYFLQALSWGRVLTEPHGPGALRGRFQWSFEVVPLYSQYDPISTYGFGFTPLHWRWNFEPRGRFSPFAELAGGALWTRDPVPIETSTSNFTAHAGFGVRYFFRPPQALVFGYRFHHISNGNRLEKNPGVNAHVLQVGWTLMRPR